MIKLKVKNLSKREANMHSKILSITLTLESVGSLFTRELNKDSGFYYGNHLHDRKVGESRKPSQC
jgi:Na+/phosphate symporter